MAGHPLLIENRTFDEIDGSATVLAPTEKVRRPRFALPEVSLHEPRPRVVLRTLVWRPADE